MRYVVILWLAANVAATPSTEQPEKNPIQLGNDRDSGDVTAGPDINPSTIGSHNQEYELHNIENQENRENIQEKENEEERLEESVQPNLVNGDNVYSNAAIPEPIVAIPAPVYEDANVPIQSRWPSLSGLFSFLPSWITSLPFKWPFKKTIFPRASVFYPEYYPEDESEQSIYTYY